jgi:hypothetical protein
MIVKVQKALLSPGTVLIYDEGAESSERVDTESGSIPVWTHGIYAQIYLGAEHVRAILGDDLKGYFEATLEGDDVVIGERVDDQDW